MKAEKNGNEGALGVDLTTAARTADLSALYSSAEGLMFSEHCIFVPKSA